MTIDFTPVIRVLHKGRLAALTSATGVVVYSTAEGDGLLGSSCGPRGNNLSQYLESNSDVVEFFSFLSQRGHNQCKVNTRRGNSLVLEADTPNSTTELNMDTASCDEPDSIGASSPIQSLLRSKAIENPLNEEMSFNDAFEQAAVEHPQAPSMLYTQPSHHDIWA